ncbi:MAG: DUF4097 domain-containing protein [Acidobacteria bacterium]|nr:DUF4097 domain-containing protein [Acidobacteriota bacterium]
MKSVLNNSHEHAARSREKASRGARTIFALAALSLVLAAAPCVLAQKRFNREYAAQPNVRLHLNNRSGTITIIAWNRPKIRVSAEMENSSARMTPEMTSDDLVINVLRENREDIGDINFTIQVPVNTTVDISTMRGNITIRNVRGEMVRANVSTEGDIELTGIRATTVMVENTVGNILFDAELLRGGTYELKSTQGNIQIRITAESGFRLMATAPHTRNIDLGGFADKGQFEFFNDKRRIVGKVGDGGASLNTTNGRGSIVLMPR